MMNDDNVLDTEINIYEAYANLDVSDKRKELGREITELTIVVKKLLSDITIEFPIDSLEEFENLYDGNCSEDEYLTGLYEDVLNFKELLAMYLERVIFYNNEQNDEII